MIPDTLLQLLQLFVLRLVLGMLDGDIRSDSLMNLEHCKHGAQSKFKDVTYLIQGRDADNDGRRRAGADILHPKAHRDIFHLHRPPSDRQSRISNDFFGLIHSTSELR